MFSIEGPTGYSQRWVPMTVFVVPTLFVVMEKRPRYWRIAIAWLWWTFGFEWEPKGGRRGR